MNDALRHLNTETQEAMDGSAATARDAAGYIHMKFQCGPIQEHGVNGTSIENVIALLVDRLEGFQRGPFACYANKMAIDHLNMAIEDLESRTRDRLKRGVEGRLQQ